MSEIRGDDTDTDITHITQSVKFVQSFYPIRVFLMVFGRLPFYIKTNVSESYLVTLI